MAKILFDSKFLHQLDSLKLVSKRARKIFFQGEKREEDRKKEKGKVSLHYKKKKKESQKEKEYQPSEL